MTEQVEEKIDIPFRFFFLARCRIICRKKGKPSVYRLTSEKRFRNISLMEEDSLHVITYLKYCVQFLVYITKSSFYDLSSIVHTANIKIRPRAKRPGRLQSNMCTYFFEDSTVICIYCGMSKKPNCLSRNTASLSHDSRLPYILPKIEQP